MLMFTGIVQAVGHICKAIPGDQGLCIWISGLPQSWNVPIGGSVANNGVCLTLLETKPEVGSSAPTLCAKFDVGHETLRITGDQWWTLGCRTNLEPALRIGDPLGGHLVLGHVDGTARVVKTQEQHGHDGEVVGLSVYVELPEDYIQYCALKGSITLHGISLTINEVNATQIRVDLIPHTLQETNILQWTVDSPIHFEVDHQSRQIVDTVERLLQERENRNAGK